MKKLFLLFTIALIALLELGCGTTVPQVSTRKPAEVDTAYVYHMPSLIYSIDRGNRGNYHSLYSDSALSIRSQVFKEAANLPMQFSTLNFKNESEKWFFDKYLNSVINFVESKRKISKFTLEDTVANYLQSKNVRYALITFQTGFTRTPSNYGKEVAKSIGIGLLTLGTFIPVPIKANSTIICFVIDVERKNIAFYRRKLIQNEPLESKIIRKQIKVIMYSWLYTTPN